MEFILSIPEGLKGLGFGSTTFMPSMSKGSPLPRTVPSGIEELSRDASNELIYITFYVTICYIVSYNTQFMPFLFILLLLLNIGCISTSVLENSYNYPPRTNTIPIPEKTGQIPLARQPINKNYYIVKRNDTLFSIARKFNLRIEKLMEANKLNKNSILIAGTKLAIPYSFSSTKTYSDRENKVLFSWPVQGKIINYFGENINNKKNKGIEIQTKENTYVLASAEGKVTFSDYIKGYGKTIIIKHYNDISTVYTNLSTILVKDGNYVKRGQAIAKAGKDLHRGIIILHFEIRKGYKAQNPLVYLKH